MPDENLDARIAELGQAARAAGRVIAASSAEARNQAVRTTASLIRERTGAIVEANTEDVEAAKGASGRCVHRPLWHWTNRGLKG